MDSTKVTDLDAMKDSDNLLELIGNTPCVRIRRLNPNPAVEVLAKLESFNPGGSVKDRIALSMILSAEESGELTGEKTVLEATSGNTGIGLAMVAAVKGYRLLLVMPKSASSERKAVLRALGAELLLTPPEAGTDGAIEEAYRLAREDPDRYFLADQFNNENNWKAHYEHTAREIWEQTGGRVTMFVGTMGTTGTLMGVSRRLKECNPEVRIVGVEPQYDHRLQGMKNMKESYKPGIFDKSLLDERVLIEDDDAFRMARELAKKEGIFCGMSSGAAVHVALRKAEELTGGVIVVLLPDGGERYLSTPLYELAPAVRRKRSELRFYNTMAREKQVFEPLVKGRIRMYSCGPTVFATPHIGHFRSFVFADLVKRYLKYRGYQVKHIMNITDIDDRTIAASGDRNVSLAEYTRQYEQEFMQGIEELNILKASKYPRATDHVAEMIELARTLVRKGYAYERHSSVYFDLSKFADYGRLSRVDLGKVKVGATVDLDEYEKDNPRDFTLLKRSTLSELKRGIFYETEWGKVRPGWHLECSAMALKYLGDTIDIHTSGVDLIFPHHENEIAQSEAYTGRKFVNYWLHCEHVVHGGKKMTRRNGQLRTLGDLYDRGYSARTIRFYLIGTHYRQRILFTFESLDAARSALERLDEFVRTLSHVTGGDHNPEVDGMIAGTKRRFDDALNDDINISRALSAVFDLAAKTNRLLSKRRFGRKNARSVLALLKKLDRVLAVLNFGRETLSREEQRLLDEREKAREAGDWQRADELRSRLGDAGLEVQDTPTGSRWRKKRSS